MILPLYRPNYILITDFDDMSLQKFVDEFIALESDPQVEVIMIYVSSYGGEVYAMMAMRDLIKTSSKIVSTVAIGKAMSSGAFLLASGSKGYRFASENTEIMVHEVASASDGKASDIIQAAHDIERLNRKVFKNFAADTDVSVEEFLGAIKEKTNSDWHMTAQDAKKWGIIDEVGLPRLVRSSSASNVLVLDKPKKRTRKKAEKA